MEDTKNPGSSSPSPVASVGVSYSRANETQIVRNANVLALDIL